MALQGENWSALNLLGAKIGGRKYESQLLVQNVNQLRRSPVVDAALSRVTLVLKGLLFCSIISPAFGQCVLKNYPEPLLEAGPVGLSNGTFSLDSVTDSLNQRDRHRWPRVFLHLE